MFKQKVILQFNKEVESLYVRRKDNEISFDTFFNSLNLFLVKKYTDANYLKIVLSYVGSGTIEICFESENEKLILYSEAPLSKEVEVDISQLGESGIVYPIIRGDVDLKEITYFANSNSRQISTCAIFTTYNRQEFLIPNLYKLNSCDSIDKVIIVDNAKNVELPADLPRDKFIIVPNDNLGGTGGFTRGMIEAKKTGVSHIFIMDDDITLIPEVIDKALSLISSLKPSHENDWLGFSMLPNGSPTTQYELGTKWNGIKMCLNNHMLDVSKKEKLFKNQINSKYNYSAWWSLIMPISVIDKYGYPFPFFIKFDDIEYALRRTGEEIILTNGFAVWHEDFDKKYNPYLEYYLYRKIFYMLHLYKL